MHMTARTAMHTEPNSRANSDWSEWSYDRSGQSNSSSPQVAILAVGIFHKRIDAKNEFFLVPEPVTQSATDLALARARYRNSTIHTPMQARPPGAFGSLARLTV